MQIDPTLEIRVDKDVSLEAVKNELEARHYIIIPSRKSIFRTPELSAKREILMQMVYRGEISLDLFTGTNLHGEAGLVFYNTKPHID